jgi:hypothetical protein
MVVRTAGSEGVEVKLRRFADVIANAAVGTVAPGQPRLVRIPADASTEPDRAQLASATGLAVCSM